MKTNKIEMIQVAGMTTYFETSDGLRVAEFNADYATPVAKPYEMTAHVQRLRNGSLIMTEKPKRRVSHAKTLWRGKHTTLSLTIQGRLLMTHNRNILIVSEREAVKEMAQEVTDAMAWLFAHLEELFD
jgi:hypothetical protein